MTTYVHVAGFEPEHEVAEKLLDLARRAGYPPSVVGTSRDEGLVFSVPDDVADEFNAARAELWTDPALAGADPAPVRRRGPNKPKIADQE
jgi:hypothetical protein